MALATLVQGSAGLEVENLQRALNYHLPTEFPLLVPDRIFGPKTRARVITFQRAHDLKPDAIVGPKTRQALYTFVEPKHYLVLRTQTAAKKVHASLPVSDSRLPPAPRPLELRWPPYPTMRVPIPKDVLTFPLFQPIPYFRIDPQVHLWLRTMPFEVEKGTRMSFRDPEIKKPAGFVYFEIMARIWSAPINRKLTASAGMAFGGEKRLSNGTAEMTLSAVIGVEAHDLVTAGPVDIMNFQLEAQVEKSTGQKPVDMSATFEVGPTIETDDKRFSFHIGGYLGIKSNGKETDFDAGAKVWGSMRFGGPF
jgi:hypothetical protein